MVIYGLLKSFNLLQVSTQKVTVKDAGGRTIDSQLLPLSNVTLGIRNLYVKAYLGKSPSETVKYWLAFSASVPPLGFSTYVVSIAKQTGYCYSVEPSLVKINIWQRVQVTDNFLLFFLYIFSYEDRGSTISTVYSPKGSMSNNIEIGQGNLKLLYSGGKVTHYVNNRNLVCYCLDASIFVIFC